MFVQSIIRILTVALAMIVLTASSGLASTNQALQNGSFESPAITTSYAPLNGPARNGTPPVTLTGWSSTTSLPSNPDTQNYIYTSAFDHTFDGQQGLLFNGDGAAITTLSQTIGTVPGDSYVVQFELSAQTPGANGAYENISDSHLDLAATGNAQAVYADPTVVGTNGAFPFLPESYSFVAAGSSTTLTFTQSDGADLSPLLDDVQVTQVPEPASAGILGSAAVFLLFRRARRPTQ